MRHTATTPILEAHVRAAWQTQMAAAVNTPGLWPALVRRRAELFPRFATYYTQLQALPRRVRRALQRQWRLPLAGVALMLALGQSPSRAATIPVEGACTLVAAITAANTDTATEGCPAGSGADTIVLPAGSTQMLTEVNNDTYGPTGLPVVSSVVTIAGQGSTIARDSGAPEFRLFAVSNTGDLTLEETTMSGGIAPNFHPPYQGEGVYPGGGVANYGTLTITNSTITGNTAESGGGVNNGGTLTLTNSTISGNTTYFGSGGGVSNGGTISVINSTISGNYANYNGGGVSNGGLLTITNSIISGNTARNRGGGVLSFYGPLTITNSTISDNFAHSGGGVYNSAATFTLMDSTISDNSAYYCGGGVVSDGCGISAPGTSTIVMNSTITGNTAGFRSGGVSNGGLLTVTNSTISGNTGSNEGGGVYNQGGTLTLTHSTITGNTADSGGGVWNSAFGTGTLTLARTLVSGNAASNGPEIYKYSGTVIADNHNLFGFDGTAGVEGFSPGATDIVPPAGVLLPDILDPTLAFTGGPTQTHALVLGSPAIDEGGTDCLDASGAPLVTDQRGRPRLVDGDGDGRAACDIGAVEFFPLVNDFVTLDAAPETTSDPTPVPDGPAGTFTITATFTNTSDTPLRVPFLTVTDLSGDNLLLNAVEGAMGVGGTVPLEVGDNVLALGETVTVDFVVGLQAPERFRFFVDLFGEPVR